jgi:hypothetical protein
MPLHHIPSLSRPARPARLGLALLPVLLAACGSGDDDNGPGIVSPLMQGQVSAYSAAMGAVDASINAGYGSFRAYLPTGGATRAQLFVLLPASPVSPNDYRLVGEYAAVAGLYSIGLPYVNGRSVNTVCANSTDAACHAHVRQAQWAGGDVPLAVPAVSISSTDSIQNRLAKTLAYLHATYPTAGWGQFLDTNGRVLWSSVRVGGHGEGGAEAAYIATQTAVVQACMLSAPGDVVGTAPAAWITAATTTSATPGAQFRGFTHLQDATTPFATLQAAWAALGLTGTATTVDGATAPYGGSHQLTTHLAMAAGTDYHAVTALDLAVPLNTDGTARYAPAWAAACF